MKSALLLAWSDMKRRLIASAMMMIQFYIIGMLLIWITASVPYLLQSGYSSYQEELYQDTVVFIDANVDRTAALSQNAIRMISEICDDQKTGYAVFDVDSNWTLIVGDPFVAGQIKVENQADIVQNSPYILVGCRIDASNSISLPRPEIVDQTIDAGLISAQPDSNLIVSGKMNQGSYYIDESGYHSLDDRIVLCMSYEMYNSLSGHHDIFLNGLQLNSLNNAQVSVLTNTFLREQGINWFRPLQINEYQKNKQSEVWSSLYFIFFVAIFLILIISGMTLYFIQLIKTNHREYAIHRICGASLNDVKRRMLFLIVYILSPPTVFLTLFVFMLHSGGDPQAPPLLYVPVFAVLTVVAVYALPARQIERQDIAGFIRLD